MDTNYDISTEELAGIEQYLFGELSPQQKHSFESRISTDSRWAAKVSEVRLLLLGIETASLQERMNAYHTRIKKNHPQAGGGKIIWWQRKMLVAASVVLLVAISVWVFVLKENKDEKLYAAYYKPDPGLMSAMSVGGNYVFNKAMLDYKTGNYTKAISEWSKLKTGMAPNDTLDYFIGAAQQANGNTSAAMALLKPIVQDTAKPFYKDACWYLGLAMVKQGKATEAIPFLEKSGRPQSSELISKLK